MKRDHTATSRHKIIHHVMEWCLGYALVKAHKTEQLPYTKGIRP